MRYDAILMFGVPGSGKGTQGEVLGKIPNLLHLAMGDIFRNLDKHSPIGQEFLSYSTKGLLVPDELTVRVWQTHVQNLIDRGMFRPNYHALILDGIPRTTDQVQLLADRVNILRVVHLVIPDAEKLINRLRLRAEKANRPDDADVEVIRKRLEVYHAQTAPVLQRMNQALIAEVNADQKPLEVLRDICDVLADVVPADI